MRYEMGDGWACVDCAMLIANGDMPNWMDQEQCEQWIADIALRTHGHNWDCGRSHADCDHDEFDDDARSECETITFSSRTCDVCGTNLAGHRLGVHWYREKESVR